MGVEAGEGLAFQPGGGDRRVMQQAKLVVVAGVKAQEKILRREAQAQRHGAQDHLRVRVRFPVKCRREGAEAREDGFG